MEELNYEGGAISRAQAKEMIDAYQHDNPDNTQSVWFSVEQLNQIVNKLNEQVDQFKADGLRVYFGKYTSETTKNPEYRDKNTVIFVPTHDSPQGHADYLDVDAPKKFWPQNTGELCPPSCGISDF